ncbi:apolipoprotein N-acyltransferase [Blochmannia endosymbiont of Polyrhachis (Hedomyrma) turneri]|uniref:apolipoprotein N-acyltransferase n=1 Tax=Blochmannia endosymbiont of Polyrhachis (Hedomyrma) turneri TaxID=1505596 RepID=UPI00061A6404|nr:apolipoprotein N-acyltransferase [Blochmannia endosymbiont of Polyrhachis (Hedomyrma) turneri]AKC59885.1 Apolipoprotein N-acyltransferase [Blochmannia endosymbiont of Polyrhachis (Hedomyrma) turneri]
MNDQKRTTSQLNYYIFRILSATLAGLCGTLSFSPYNFWPAAIFSLTGLLLVITNCNYYQSSCFSFFWGIGLFGTGINWVYISIHQFGNIPKLMSIMLMFVLIIYLTCYPVVFSILLVQIWPISTYSRLIFAAPTLWISTEMLRGYLFGGFPWLQFGYSQINAPLKGLAPILGMEGITFGLMLISGLFVCILLKKHSLLLIISTTILIVFLWALQLIHWYHLVPQKSIVITLIQGNINQTIKWNADYISQILNTYLQHSFNNIKKSKIIIWPESAIPDSEIAQNNFLTQLDLTLRHKNVSLITGIIDVRYVQHRQQYYNSIIVIGDSTPYYYSNNNRYIKYHLVPFGETIPCKRYLESFFSFFNFPFSCLTSGKYLQPQLTVANIKFTASICYEIIFGNRIRNNFQADTDFLLTISNNAWFGCSIEPWQHLQIAQMRALELGRPLIHSTNNGITAFIAANGKLQSTLPQCTEAVLTNKITPTKGITPYVRLGSYPLKTILIIFTILAIKNK